MLPRAESDSDRLVVFLSLGSRIFWHHPQSAAALLALTFPPFLATFSRVVAGDRGHFLPFRRILGDQWLVATGKKANSNGWSCKLRWSTGRVSFTRATNLLASSTERCLPVHPRVPALPSELCPVLLRGVGATSCRSGGFWVTTRFLPRAENKSERLVLQTSLVRWSFSSTWPENFLASSTECCRSLDPRVPSLHSNFSPCCRGGSGPLPVVPEDSG